MREPTNDVKGLEKVQPWVMEGIIFNNEQGQTTVVPMVHTLISFFYRTDLVKESELPKTWADMVTISRSSTSNVLWDADFLCKRQEPFFRVISMTEKAYGHQTGVLLERV